MAHLGLGRFVPSRELVRRLLELPCEGRKQGRGWRDISFKIAGH